MVCKNIVRQGKGRSPIPEEKSYHKNYHENLHENYHKISKAY